MPSWEHPDFGVDAYGTTVADCPVDDVDAYVHAKGAIGSIFDATAGAAAGRSNIEIGIGTRQVVLIVGVRVVNKQAVRRSAIRSTKASAKLERRTVPRGFVRSQRVEQFLAQRRQQG